MNPQLPPIVIDTREQDQLAFGNHKVEVVRAKLDAGDYSLLGYEDRVAIERKSHSDAWNMVTDGTKARPTGNRTRFEACLERLAQLDRAYVLIECPLDEFGVPPVPTRVSSASAIGSYISWSVRYGVPTYWMPNRHYSASMVVRLLAAYVKYRG